MKTKKLYESNMETLVTVLTELQHGNIQEFETQSLFYKFLEEIKFPYTMRWRETRAKWRRPNYDRNPFYTQVNYLPITHWLKDRGIISVERTVQGKKKIVYKYKVNQKALENLQDLSPTYTTR